MVPWRQSGRKKQRTLFRYLSYAKPYRWMIALVIVAGIAKFTLPIVPAHVSGLVVDKVILNEDGRSQADIYSLLWTLAAVLVGVAFAEALAIFVRGYATVRTSTSVAFDIRQDLWAHLQRLSLSFHQSRPTGTLLSRLMSDISVSQQMINAGIINVMIDAASGTIALVVLLSISWQLTLLVLSVMPLYAFLYRKINPQLRQASHDVQEQTSVMSGKAVERLAGIAVVQSFAQERSEHQSFAAEADELRGRAIRRGRLNQTLNSLSNLLIAVASNLVWVVGAWMAIRPGSAITAGDIIKFTQVAALLYLPIRRMSEINIMFQTSMAAIERVFSLFDVVPQLQSKPQAVETAPAEGRIEFDRVGFGYEADNPVLRDVNFTIEPGERVAIVGESGAGKSTLVGLIPRLHDVTEGCIRIDGVDVRDYRLRRLRRNIGIVLQDTILFSGPVRENLRYGRKNASEEEIVAAARSANAHGFITALPRGYDTEIGERGLSLSGGQRQRMSLARTVLQNPRILILDEATSALDSESENLITEAMERVMQGRTCLIIAHRLSTIMGADRILVFREGRLVEQGPHKRLLQAGGYYRYLFEQQFGPLQQLLAESHL
jgi:subfamily B ATP-binding cassette protein MsbA